MPPFLMRVRVRVGGKWRGLSLWLPLFLVWLPAAALVVLMLPVLLIVDTILSLRRSRFSCTGAVWTVWRVLCETSGLMVEVRRARGDGEVLVQMF